MRGSINDIHSNSPSAPLRIFKGKQAQSACFPLKIPRAEQGDAK